LPGVQLAAVAFQFPDQGPVLAGDEHVGEALPPWAASLLAPGVGDVEPDEWGLQAVTDGDNGGLEVALGHLRLPPRAPNLIRPSLPHFMPRAECWPVCPRSQVQRARNGLVDWWPQALDLPNMVSTSESHDAAGGPAEGSAKVPVLTLVIARPQLGVRVERVRSFAHTRV
jgi:hypothetical protein